MGNKKRIRDMANIAGDVFFHQDWKVNGERVRLHDEYPAIEEIIRGLKKRASAEGVQTVESNRIMVSRDDIDGDEFFEVYLNIGNLN